MPLHVFFRFRSRAVEYFLKNCSYLMYWPSSVLNTTAAYHRHVLRLPIFVKKAFEKMKTFFFSKKHSFFIIFSNFSHVQIFLTSCQKTSLPGRKRHFKAIIPFETHSKKKIATFSVAILKNFKVFFRKNLSIFPKKPKYWTFWEFLSNNTILDAF